MAKDKKIQRRRRRRLLASGPRKERERAKKKTGLGFLAAQEKGGKANSNSLTQKIVILLFTFTKKRILFLFGNSFDTHRYKFVKLGEYLPPFKRGRHFLPLLLLFIPKLPFPPSPTDDHYQDRPSSQVFFSKPGAAEQHTFLSPSPSLLPFPGRNRQS